MSKVLIIVAILAGIWTAFIGAWGLAESGSASTVELQEMGFWLALAVFSSGVGLIAAGAARLSHGARA